MDDPNNRIDKLILYLTYSSGLWRYYVSFFDSKIVPVMDMWEGEYLQVIRPIFLRKMSDIRSVFDEIPYLISELELKKTRKEMVAIMDYIEDIREQVGIFKGMLENMRDDGFNQSYTSTVILNRSSAWLQSIYNLSCVFDLEDFSPNEK